MEQINKDEIPEVIFANISGDNEPTVIESLCVDCLKNGKTIIMMCNIPMFKQIIVTSFYCENCGNKNNNVEFSGKIDDYAATISLKCTNMDDFKRDVVRSEHGKIQIPELDFEIPCNKKGQVNTIEGFLTNAIEDLESEQEQRKTLWPDLYTKIGQFIVKLKELLEGKLFPFHFIIDDMAGNSFIKNPIAPKIDPNLKKKQRVRTQEEYQVMGYSIENQSYEMEAIKLQEALKQKEIAEGIHNQPLYVISHKTDYTQPFDEENAKKESLSFPITCHGCMKDGENKMCVIDIPYFKEVTIMSFNCDYCGCKNSEVKVGGGISDQGIKIILNSKGDEDLKRDLFKSDTCGVQIPELDIELDHGTLGGVYTTVEGLLEKIEDNLVNNNPFTDSDKQFKDRMEEISQKIKLFRDGKTPFTLILEDMLENSFIQNPKFPEKDENCVAELFDRTQDMKEILGLNDMKV